MTDLKAHVRDSGMMSVPEVRSLLASHGVDVRVVAKSSLASLSGRTPFIAHLTEGHFVVVASVDERSVSVIDPSYSRTDVFTEPLDALERRWSGYAIVARRP